MGDTNNINELRKPLPPLPNNLQQSDKFSSQKTSMQFYQQNNSQVLPERASDFAAHMTCFLWFGDYIMDSSSITPPPGGNGHRRFPDFKPRDAFKKFCRDVISATQVSRSVILLSLLYIHRMKINNPAIKGQNGSEYRTFTVALMLANKFLDDNTYTNKTWSEVTNIPVSEINTMEMEFLGSLNYKLYVSEKQYFEWVQSMTTFIQIGDNFHNNNDNSSPDCTVGRASFCGWNDGITPKKNKCLSTYPTPPPSGSSSRRVSAYYNIPTTSSTSSNMVYSSQSSQQSFEVRQTYTNVTVRNTQPQYAVVDPVGIYYARRVQSNLINARSTSSGFPVNNISFTTTVV
ncbi:5138_t:CDS:2 [Scutellospora calospora]|uniref:5138_t:CDS:1 n=1 Tax=Scutellospora calospora TaxID=85575 RepID=A0ACA9JY63_9GLOM|nr:5138_t:CDS:2 [Scutellospora calospora]